MCFVNEGWGAAPAPLSRSLAAPFTKHVLVGPAPTAGRSYSHRQFGQAKFLRSYYLVRIDCFAAMDSARDDYLFQSNTTLNFSDLMRLTVNK